VHLALQLAPVLAAEKSKVPFYIAGGALVVWALFISMAIGMRRDKFPANDGQQRAVMGISAVFVLAALVTAVVTGGTPEKTEEAKATPTSPAAETTAPATTPKTTTPKTTGEGQPATTKPTATTGTPAPPSSPAGKTTVLKLAADPGGQLAYETQQLTAKAGTVSIEFANASPVEHDVTIAEGSKILGATPTFVGGKRTLTLKLTPGDYVFYCSVPGHKQAGMEGKLKVVS
jgi:plastocyanin